MIVKHAKLPPNLHSIVWICRAACVYYYNAAAFGEYTRMMCARDEVAAMHAPYRITIRADNHARRLMYGPRALRACAQKYRAKPTSALLLFSFVCVVSRFSPGLTKHLIPG